MASSSTTLLSKKIKCEIYNLKFPSIHLGKSEKRGEFNFNCIILFNPLYLNIYINISSKIEILNEILYLF